MLTCVSAHVLATRPTVGLRYLEGAAFAGCSSQFDPEPFDVFVYVCFMLCLPVERRQKHSFFEFVLSRPAQAFFGFRVLALFADLAISSFCFVGGSAA